MIEAASGVGFSRNVFSRPIRKRILFQIRARRRLNNNYLRTDGETTANRGVKTRTRPTTVYNYIFGHYPRTPRTAGIRTAVGNGNLIVSVSFALGVRDAFVSDEETT